jgi:hypothetical protein
MNTAVEVFFLLSRLQACLDAILKLALDDLKLVTTF